MKDPRRRFMFGFTLNNEYMDLWYVDQTDVLMAETIQWLDNVSACFTQ